MLGMSSNSSGLSNWAYILLVIPILTTSIVTIINTWQGRKIHKEVKTFNESTIGQLGEANEARRISHIPLEQRTPKEKRHMGMTDTNTVDDTQSIPNPNETE